MKAIIVIFALLFLVGMCSSNPPPVPTKTPEQIKATKERDIKLNKVIAGAYTLKKAARNPDSFKLTSAMVMDNGASCYEYRAQNGFGGMNVGSAVMHNGDIIMNESVGFVKKWNKVCAKQPGVEFKEDVNIAFEILDSVHPKTITY